MTTKVIPFPRRLPSGETIRPRTTRVPRPPQRMKNKRARELWRIAARDLHDRGTLSPLYLGGLEAYCYSVARAEELTVAAMHPRAHPSLKQAARESRKLACDYAANFLQPRPQFPRPQRLLELSRRSNN